MPKQTEINIETLELLPVAAVLLDNNCIYYINQKGLALFKLPKHINDSISNFNFFEFIHESYHQRIKKRNREILKGSEFPTLTLPCFDFEKNELLVKVKSNSIFFNGKKVIQSIFFDITDELQNNSKLQRANALLENFNSNVNDIIFEQSFIPHPHIKYISDSVFNILGRTPQEVYEDQNIFLEQMHVDDRVNYVTSLQHLIEIKKKEKTYKATFRFFHSNGKLMYLESVATPVYKKKQIIGLVGVIRNITNEKNQQLLINQKWNSYKNLIDTSPIGIIIHNGPCLYINQAAAQILEESNFKKIIGKELIHFIIPEQQKTALLRTSEAIKGNKQGQLIYTIKTYKGNYKQVELKSVPFNYNGEACVQTVISDVSIQQKFEDEKLRTKLAEKVNTVLVNVINDRKKAEAKLDAVFNTSSHIIWTIDRNFKLTSFNKNFYNHIKKHYNREVELNGDYKLFCKSIYSEKVFKNWIHKMNEAFLGNNIVFEKKVYDYSKQTNYFEVFFNPIFNDKKIVQEVAAISHDITERKVQEEKIHQQAAKLQAIFDSGNQLSWTINKELLFTSFNKNFEEAMFALYKIQPTTESVYEPQKKTKKGREIHQWWIDKYKEVFNTGKSLDFTTEQIQDNKEIHYRQIFFHPIFNKQGVIDEISCTSNDITELKYLQNQSFTQNAKLKSILESSSHLVWTVNPDYCLTSFNTNFSNLFEFNYSHKPIINEKLHLLIPEDKREDYQAFWYTNYKKAFLGKPLKIEQRQINKQGVLAYNEIYINPIKNSNNEIIEIACLAHDITENKLNEEKLIQSLKEKEVLLKEVHHRVKNNMQVISSILNLQSSYVKDSYTLGLLKESQNRIKSMSFIHESLYQTQNFEVVNFTDYIITLSKNLIHSYSVNLNKINLNLNLDKLFLTLDISIPCGLIINEIISNSLKYAFPNNQDGDIFLTLKENNNKICLEIGDNGVGIPNHIDIKHTETLGLQLVDTLVEQINATLVLDKSKGTKFIIEFNKITKNGK